MRYITLSTLIVLFPLILVVSVIRAYRQNPDEFKFYTYAVALAFAYGIWFRVKPIVVWTKFKWEKVTNP